jgi:hypothetical protein
VKKSPVEWSGDTNETAIKGFIWMEVKGVLNFFFSQDEVRLEVGEFDLVVPTNRTEDDENEFREATFVRSSFFAPSSRWAEPEVALAKKMFLTEQDPEHYVLLTVYRGKTGKYDADIGIRGSPWIGEHDCVAVQREYREETGVGLTRSPRFFGKVWCKNKMHTLFY